MTIAKIFHNPSKVIYVDLSSKHDNLDLVHNVALFCERAGAVIKLTCSSNLTFKAKSESGEICMDV